MKMSSTSRSSWIDRLDASRGEWSRLYLRGGSHFRPSPPTSTRARSILHTLREHGADVRLLAAAHVLLQPDTARFVLKEVPQLLRVLAHHQQTIVVRTRARLRGRLAVSETFRARAAIGGDPSLFVCRSPVRSIDVPENHLLWHCLAVLERLCNAVLARLGSSQQIGEELTALRDACRSSLDSPVWGPKTRWHRPTALASARARRSRYRQYRQLANLYSVIADCCLTSKTNAIRALIARAWFEPISDDKLYELAVLVEVLESVTWTVGKSWSVRARTIASRSGPNVVFSDRARTRRVTVYYDQSPSSIFGLLSEYQLVGHQYPEFGIRAARPDIAVVISTQASSRLLLIECKNTADAKYARASIYKCLAYLHDFRRHWVSDLTSGTRILLCLSDEKLLRAIDKESGGALTISGGTAIRGVVEAIVSSSISAAPATNA